LLEPPMKQLLKDRLKVMEQKAAEKAAQQPPPKEKAPPKEQ